MSSEEARRLVEDGLQRRREQQKEAAREERLEAYERDMIAACNGNCADARILRLADERDRLTQAQLAAPKKEQQIQLAAQRREQREKLQKEWERDSTAMESVRAYVFFCLVVMLVTVWTPFPWWAAVALIAGTAVCLGAYVFRLYFPFQEAAYAKD